LRRKASKLRTDLARNAQGMHVMLMQEENDAEEDSGDENSPNQRVRKRSIGAQERH